MSHSEQEVILRKSHSESREGPRHNDAKLRLVHFHPGYLRIQADAFIHPADDSPVLAGAKAAAEAAAGFRSWSLKPKTGSVVIEFDNGAIEADDLLKEIAKGAGLRGIETPASRKMTREDLVQAFSFEGVNRSNAVVNFTEENPFDAKALWLNAEHIRTMPVGDLAAQLNVVVEAAGFCAGKIAQITPLIRERIHLLNDVLTVADFFFAERLAPYDAAELIPKKGDAALALRVLEKALEVLGAPTAEFTHDGLESALRGAAESLGIKAGQMFEPIRVAVCGRKTAPPLFGTLEVLGRDVCLPRIEQAIHKLK